MISAEETDLLEPTLLDELICHISSLASVYHKPPTAFVEGKVGLKRILPTRTADGEEEGSAQVIADPGSLIGDLLSMDIGGGPSSAAVPSGGGPVPDLLGGGLDQLLGGPPPSEAVAGAAAAGQSTNSLLGDIFGMGGSTHTGSTF